MFVLIFSSSSYRTLLAFLLKVSNNSCSHLCRKYSPWIDLSGRPSLMLFICQDKPIPLVRCSLRVNSFIYSLFFVPLVYQFWKENRRAVMSAYINILKRVLFLMLLCESALKFYRFLWEDAPIDTWQLGQIISLCLNSTKKSTHNIF